MILFNQLAAAVLLLSLTLCLQCAGVTTLFEWLKRVLTQGHSQAWASLLGHPGDEIGSRNCNSARARDSFVGKFLPDALLPVMGARLLLLREQLLDCGIWRSDSPVQLATLRASGGDHWCLDVRNIGQCSVCSGHSVARSRHTIFAEEFK